MLKIRRQENFWALRDSRLLWFQSLEIAPLPSSPVETTDLHTGGAFPSPGSVMATQTVLTPSMSCRTAPEEPALGENSPVQMDGVSCNHSGDLWFTHFPIRQNVHRAECPWHYPGKCWKYFEIQVLKKCFNMQHINTPYWYSYLCDLWMMWPKKTLGFMKVIIWPSTHRVVGKWMGQVDTCLLVFPLWLGYKNFFFLCFLLWEK